MNWKDLAKLLTPNLLIDDLCTVQLAFSVLFLSLVLVVVDLHSIQMGFESERAFFFKITDDLVVLGLMLLLERILFILLSACGVIIRGGMWE